MDRVQAAYRAARDAVVPRTDALETCYRLSYERALIDTLRRVVPGDFLTLDFIEPAPWGLTVPEALAIYRSLKVRVEVADRLVRGFTVEDFRVFLRRRVGW